MKCKSIIAIVSGGCIVLFVVSVVLYMKLTGGQCLKKLKALMGRNKELTIIFYVKKYIFLTSVLILNIGFCLLVYLESVQKFSYNTIIIFYIEFLDAL